MLLENLQIRSANANDLTHLDKLMYKLHDHHHEAQPDFFKTAEEIDKEKSISHYLNDPECLVFVAELNQSQLIGFISGHFCELTSTVSKPVPMGSIDEFFVLEGYRKTHVAQDLFNRMELTFFDYGVQQLFVEVWHFNKIGKGFYQKMGFKHHIHWLRKSLITIDK